MGSSAKSVAFVSSNVLSRHSAAVICMIEMCNAFSKNGFNTTLCVPRFNMSKDFLFEYYGVEYPFKIVQINIPKLFLRGVVPGRSAIFSFIASNILHKMKNTIFYTRNPWIFFIISSLYKWHSFFEVHQFRFKGPLATCIYRAMIKYSAKHGKGRIVCISKSLMNQWEKYGIDSTKMFVAHDAVNINKFNNIISKSEARKQLRINKSLSLVVYTGSLKSGKGVDVLIKCANRLPEISFLIVGGEEEQIKKFNILVKFKNVVFTGRVQPTKIPIYQAAADILTLPNTKGSVIDDVTSPLKLFEYMASGRPIVATDMPSILEILKNNYNALISPAEDDYKLSENISVLFKYTSLGEILTKNARKDIEKYSWDARVHYLMKIFDSFN